MRQARISHSAPQGSIEISSDYHEVCVTGPQHYYAVEQGSLPLRLTSLILIHVGQQQRHLRGGSTMLLKCARQRASGASCETAAGCGPTSISDARAATLMRSRVSTCIRETRWRKDGEGRPANNL